MSCRGFQTERIQKAIETTATIDADRRLILDTDLPVAGPMRVKVITLIAEPTDLGDKLWLSSAKQNPAFDFLNDPQPADHYSQDSNASWADYLRMPWSR